MFVNNRRNLVAVLGIAVLLVTGCAELGPKYTADTQRPTDKATIYVYRQPAFIGAGVNYQVSANGVPISRLPSGGYFAFHAAPGEVEFSAKTEARTSVTVDAKAGEVYYIKGTVGIGVFVGHPHLGIVSKDVGEREIATCKLVPGTVPTAEDVAAGRGNSAASSGAFDTVVVSIEPGEIVPAPVVQSTVPVEIVDRRAKVVMERTAMGQPMGGIVLQPKESELVSAIVTAKVQEALAAHPGLANEPGVSCEINDFSVTTPSTAFYWDVSTRVEWVLRVGDQQRTVTATGTQRTYLWPSAAVIKTATVQALQQASTQTGLAINELLAAEHQ